MAKQKRKIRMISRQLKKITTIDSFFPQTAENGVCCYGNLMCGVSPFRSGTDCGHPGQPLSGNVVLDDHLNFSFVAGATANFSCPLTGHRLVGDGQRTCQSDGTWSGQEARCGQPPLRLFSPSLGGRGPPQVLAFLVLKQTFLHHESSWTPSSPMKTMRGGGPGTPWGRGPP